MQMIRYFLILDPPPRLDVVGKSVFLGSKTIFKYILIQKHKINILSTLLKSISQLKILLN